MAFREGDQAFIIENNSHVTPVYIVRKDGDFYTIEFSNYSRINLRESRLYHTREDAENKIRRTPSVRRQVILAKITMKRGLLRMERLSILKTRKLSERKRMFLIILRKA